MIRGVFKLGQNSAIQLKLVLPPREQFSKLFFVIEKLLAGVPNHSC